MRCKKHLTDSSSSVGVCATCLRDRLFILAADQAQSQAQDKDRALQDWPVTFRHNSVNCAAKSPFFPTPQLKKHHRSRSGSNGSFGFLGKLFGFDLGSGRDPRKARTDRGMSPERALDPSDSVRAGGGGPRPNRTGLALNVSGYGFGFCLSPIVRPKTSRGWMAPPVPHLSSCGSRKLCDLGRLNRNR